MSHTHGIKADGYYGLFQDLRLDRQTAAGVEKSACRPQETGLREMAYKAVDDGGPYRARAITALCFCFSTEEHSG